MRLILEYEAGDGYEFSCTNTYPIIYESAEKFLVDLMDMALITLKTKNQDEFTIAGHIFYSSDFYSYCDADYVKKNRQYVKFIVIGDVYYLPVNPSVYTVDEWFSQVEK